MPGTGEPWDTVVSLRVEDDVDPLDELARLLDLHGAYALLSEGDEASARGDAATAADRFQRASALADGEREIRFWGALGRAETGDDDEAVRELTAICAEDPALARAPRPPPRRARPLRRAPARPPALTHPAPSLPKLGTAGPCGAAVSSKTGGRGAV